MCPVGAKVDEVYRNLHCLCDVLDEKTRESHDPNPHGLLVRKSNELLDGLNKLFTQSDDKEQVHRSLVLRRNQCILADPQCLRRNVALSEETIDTVVKFHCEDGISRTSSHSKDTIKINGQLVAVRFMEMTVWDAYRIFNERHPRANARSTFQTLRPRVVKIASPHATCMYTIHENMDLLLKVCVNLILIRLSQFIDDRLGTTTIRNAPVKLLREQVT